VNDLERYRQRQAARRAVVAHSKQAAQASGGIVPLPPLRLPPPQPGFPAWLKWGGLMAVVVTGAIVVWSVRKK
jgi:hypothetical protein